LLEPTARRLMCLLSCASPLAAKQAIDWARQWYAVAFKEDLEPTVPYAFTVLGKELVAWADKQVGARRAWVACACA
jgi:hypothetical protein